METASFSEDLQRYISLLWRWAWLLGLATVLAALTAFVVASRTTPTYQASALVQIIEAPSTKTVDMSVLQTSERLARTYVETMTTRPVLERVIENLGLVMNTSSLRDAINAQPLRDTQLIRVQVEHTDPVLAALIANALVTEFAEQNREEQAIRFAASKLNLENQLVQLEVQMDETRAALQELGFSGEERAERDRLEASLAQQSQTYASLLQSYEQVRLTEAQTTSTVVLKEPAVAATTPIRPRTATNTALASVVGLMLAVGVVFLIEALDDTLRNPDDVVRHLELPVLGIIASHDIVDGKPAATYQPRSQVAEAFRSLRTNLDFASVDHPLESILVTSPSPDEGKSTVAANLALVMAQGERKVAIIDADLRRPSIHKLLGLPNRFGISGLFVMRQVQLDGALRASEIPNLFTMTSGKTPPNPAELLGSARMGEILEQVKSVVDVVVIDCPPVLAVTDSSVLAPRLDGVLLVLKPGTTKIAAARQAVEQLRRVGAPLLGVVLNEVKITQSRYKYHSYKGYQYYYAYPEYYSADGGQPETKKLPAKR
ncbi:MAG: polysaccharide biosynthesis tyrosine autokinase [Anaerolineales bacterium]|nr:polysaccharide biosynthesis tyrosine autokinase [Anaerolineales bacterium]